jgi:hypothetical protein
VSFLQTTFDGARGNPGARATCRRRRSRNNPGRGRHDFAPRAGSPQFGYRLHFGSRRSADTVSFL